MRLHEAVVPLPLERIEALLRDVGIDAPEVVLHRRLHARMERDVVAAAIPAIAIAGEQVLHFVGIAVGLAEVFHWHVHEC